MKANELRIGNIIGDGHFMFTVAGIEEGIIKGYVYGVIKMQELEDFYNDQMYSLNDFNVEGIPLTEEWLLKFGFRKTRMKGNKELMEFIKKEFIIYLYEEIEVYFGIREKQNIKYVHQLQNLYFALTGDELTLK